MFRRVLICSIVPCLLLSGTAFARPSSYKGEDLVSAVTPVSQFRPYIGVNYVYIHQNYASSVTETIGSTTTTYNPSSTSPNNFSGVSFDSGFKYGQYIGMEFGYFQAGKKSETTGATTVSMRPMGAYMDFRAYWPIENWDIIGIAGAAFNSLGDANVKSPVAQVTIRSDNTVVPRLGLGVDYNFTPNWGIRTTAKYSFVQSNYVNNTITWDAGLYYTFA